MIHKVKGYGHGPGKGRRIFLRRGAAVLLGLPVIGRIFESKASAAGTSLLQRLAAAPHASGQPFLGEIAIVGFNFAPRGWATCDGQLLSIASSSALFSLLGTMYGGDGRTTFGLPGLSGRAALHFGNGPGLIPRSIGQRSGSPTTVLNVNNIPSHTHEVNVESATGTVDTPTGNTFATNSAGIVSFASAASVLMHQDMIKTAGSGQAINNMQPYLGLQYVIALQGVWPSRS